MRRDFQAMINRGNPTGACGIQTTLCTNGEATFRLWRALQRRKDATAPLLLGQWHEKVRTMLSATPLLFVAYEMLPHCSTILHGGVHNHAGFNRLQPLDRVRLRSLG